MKMSSFPSSFLWDVVQYVEGPQWQVFRSIRSFVRSLDHSPLFTSRDGGMNELTRPEPGDHESQRASWKPKQPSRSYPHADSCFYRTICMRFCPPKKLKPAYGLLLK